MVRMARDDGRHHICTGTGGGCELQAPVRRCPPIREVHSGPGCNVAEHRQPERHTAPAMAKVMDPGPCGEPDTRPSPSLRHLEDKLDRRRATDHEGANMLLHVSACIGCRRVFLFLSVGRMLLSQRLGSPRLGISHRHRCLQAGWQAFVNHKAPQLASGPSPRSADRRDRMTNGSVWRHRADSFWKADTA